MVTNSEARQLRRANKAAAQSVGASAPDKRRVEVVGGDSPVDVSVPFWVTACVRLQPPRRPSGAVVESAADKVLTAVQVLLADRVKAHDAVVVLDRTKIARWCGYDSPRRVSWLFDYLVSIGFLKIEQRYLPGRRGRAADTFTVFTRPPLSYVGPRTYAALDQALADPASAQPLFLTVGQNPRSGSMCPDGHQDPDLGAHMGTKTPETAGQGLDSHKGTKTEDLCAHVGTKTSKTAGQDLGAQMGTFLQIERSSISEGEIEDRSIEPVPGGAAEPPATGLTDHHASQVRELVRRLPWNEWAQLRSTNFRLTRDDADGVQAAICEAITGAGITLDQAAAVAQAALAEARSNPVGYVTDAFRRHLSRRLRALAVEPLSADPLPLPDQPTPRVGPAKTARRPESEPAASTPVRPACATCGARDGEAWNFRSITGEDGRERPCPDCTFPPPDQAGGQQKSPELACETEN